MIALLMGMVIATFATLWWTDMQIGDIETLLSIIFGPVVALVGAAVGFYFGGKAE